jgi:hypothetical protein
VPPALELDNLIDDAEKSVNLAGNAPAIVEMLRGRMNALIAKRCKQTGKGNLINDYVLGMEKHIGLVATAKKLQSR